MVNAILPACMKRRLLFAASQSYQPAMRVSGRDVGWLEPPMVVRRTLAGGRVEVAIAGRVEEGVVVAFRGSLAPFIGEAEGQGWSALLDWLTDDAAVLAERKGYPGRVHQGFATAMDRLWDDLPGAAGVHSMIQTLLERGRRDGLSRDHIFLAGHSKGGALANLCAMRAAAAPEWRRVPVSVLTIGAPRAGDAGFARAYRASRVACLRYEAAGDLVALLPPGTDSAARVRALASGMGLAQDEASDWCAVGERIGAPGHQPWAGSRRRMMPDLLGRRGLGLALGLDRLMPDLLRAHAICPGSSYDRLVCHGEGACDHGEAAITAPQGLPLRKAA